ncbi:MAG: hypothetical protein RMM08_04285 [Armatimonadota bacterium]|nr:hypothetical protein [bacterium]MDW8320562.1 hypothetical protein [Armatimonadota bacterium]
MTHEAPPQQPALTVDTVVHRPHTSSEQILETSPSRETLGGMYLVLVHNRSGETLHFTRLVIDEEDADTLAGGEKLYWWDIVPRELPPDGVATLTINGTHRLFEGERTCRAWLYTGQGHALRIVLRPFSPSLRITYAYIDGASGGVFIQNRDESNVFRLENVLLGSEKVSVQYLQRAVGPGETVLVRVILDRTLPLGALVPIRVIATDRAGKRISTGGVIRVTSMHFPVGTWDGRIWQDADYRAQLLQRGFDTAVFGAGGDEEPSQEEKQVFEQICPQTGLKALVHAGFEQVKEGFLRRNRNNLHILAYMLKDEPDWMEQPAVPLLCLQKIQMWRKHEVPQPVYINLARSRRFGEFAPLADIPSYDAYRVGAPMPDQSPHSWGNRLELAAQYTADLRLNSMPKPFWVWAQGIHTWDERVWVNEELGRAVPTPEETRVQLWFQLSRGAKGVMWFRTLPEDEIRRYYTELAQKMLPSLEPVRREDLVEQVVQQCRETLEEMTRLNRVLQAVRPFLLRCDVGYQGQARSATEPDKLDVMSLLGERVALVFVTNFAYEMHPKGYRFREQKNATALARLPNWLKAIDVFAVTPDGVKPVTWHLEKGHVRLTWRVLEEHVALVVVASDGQARQQIAQAFRQMLSSPD